MSTQKLYRPVANGAPPATASAKQAKAPRTKAHKKISQNVVQALEFYPSGSFQAGCAQPLQFKQKPSKAKANGYKPSGPSFPVQRKTQALPDMTASPSKKVQMAGQASDTLNGEFKPWRAEKQACKLIEFDDVDDSDDSIDQAAGEGAKTQSLVVLSSQTTKLLSPQDTSLKRSQHPKFEILQQSIGAQNCHDFDTTNDKVLPSEYLIDDDKTRRDSYDDSESGESQATTVGALTAAPVNGKYKLEFDNVEIISSDEQKNLTDINDQPSQKMAADASEAPEALHSNSPTKSVFNVNAPFFNPTLEESSSENQEQGVTLSKGLGGLKALAQNLESVKNNFTPSTPYVHKFRTEMCKNWELYGKCKYGDECSFAHHKGQLMVKTDVSVLYKTKLCKKFSTVGHCPYGVRCQFIHDPLEAQKQIPAPQQVQPAPQYQPVVKKEEPKAAKLELSPHSSPFVAQRESPEYKHASEQISSKRSARPVLPSEASALQLNKIVYSDILVHSFHVSVQEYQKKMKMFQKKVGKKRLSVHPPEMQYMNIYSQQLGRLPCFEAVTDQHEKEQRSRLLQASFGGRACSDDEFEDEYEGGYFFGDAQAYEHHLERQIKQLNVGMFMPSKKGEFFAPESFAQFKPVSLLQSSLESSGSFPLMGAAPSMFAQFKY